MDEYNIDELVAEAKAARENAHAPYSEFKVGAAVETDSGEVYRGFEATASGLDPEGEADSIIMIDTV